MDTHVYEFKDGQLFSRYCTPLITPLAQGKIMHTTAEFNVNAYNSLTTMGGMNKFAELGRIAATAISISIVPDTQDPKSKAWIECTLDDGSIWRVLRCQDEHGFWMLGNESETKQS